MYGFKNRSAEVIANMSSEWPKEKEIVTNGDGVPALGASSSDVVVNGNGACNGTMSPPAAADDVGAPDAKSRNCSGVLEIVGMIVLLLLVWGLLLLPIIFYHLPVELKDPFHSNTTNNSDTACVSARPYRTDGICTTELTNTLLSANCDPGETPLVLRDEESRAGLLLPLLDILGPSPACREAVVPLLCVFLFGLCDNSGVPIQPTFDQCVHVRDVLCPREWGLAQSYELDIPDCAIFPVNQISCQTFESGSGSGSASSVSMDNIQTSVSPQTPSLLQCREYFFRDEETGNCVPDCSTWTEFTQVEAIATDVVIAMAAFIGFFSGVAVLIISVIRFKRMFSFPSIFVVYLTCDLIVAEFFIIVNYFDRPSLYCTSPNLLESLVNVAPFCVISGMVFVYTILQTAIWWLFHTTTLFWKIRFPMHARSFEKAHKVKYLHFACVLAGLVLPLAPIIASMVDFAVHLESDKLLQGSNVTFVSGGLGYGQVRFPPVLCSGVDSNAVYYSSILPINIIVIVGLTELIFLFRIIYKRHRYFKSKKSSNPFKIGAAERKILIILCYYVFMTVFSLSRYTVIVRNSGPFAQQLRAYFACESSGHDPSDPCDRDSFRGLSHPVISAITLLLIGLLPAMNLVYALNVKELKEKARNCCFSSHSARKSSTGTFSSSARKSSTGTFSSSA